MAVSARNGVPNFIPEIPKYATFEKSKLFKEWLLLKLINAEIACCKAEKFKKLKERTRCILLEDLYKELNQQNLKIMQAIQTNNTLNDLSEYNSSSDNVFDTTNGQILYSNSKIEVNGRATMPSTTSTHTTSTPTSASFKFNLLNNVRKAFNIKSLKSSSSSSTSSSEYNKTNNSSSSTNNDSIRIKDNSVISQAHYIPIFSDAYSNNGSTKGRIRSSTVDVPTSLKFSSKSLKDKNEFINNTKQILPDYGITDNRVKIQQNSINTANNNSSYKTDSEINIIADYQNYKLSTSSEESSPKSLNYPQNRIEGNESKKKQQNFAKNRYA